LLDLATHSSGLPRLPPNLKPGDATNPYADYGAEQLYQFLASYEPKRDIGTEFEYSNLGAGLLGHLLARRARMEYESLVRSRITSPLGMTGTTISLTPELRARLAVGHNAELERMRDWEFGVLAGCGALRSSANDLLTFLEANLGYRKSPLAPAMAAMVQLRRPARPLGAIGLAWIMTPVQGREIVWQNGGTFGFRSFLGYDPQARRGVVVLANAFTVAGVDDIGMHLLDARSPLMAPPKVHETAEIDLKLFDGYVGRYQLAPNFILTVTRESDQLFLQATDQPKFAIFPEGPRDFFMKAVDAQITFVPDAQGRATQLILHQNGKDMPAKRIE
jgi:CubicO group peptidase (beta-lactamase class C family)